MSKGIPDNFDLSGVAVFRDIRHYKYQVHETVRFQTPWEFSEGGIRKDVVSRGDWLTLQTDGLLIIKKGWFWDGPSGPAMDTDDAIRGSLYHDAFYALMREGLLDLDIWRPLADELYARVCGWDGMSRFRVWYHFRGVSWFAEFAATPGSGKPEIIIRRAPGLAPA